MDAEFYNYLNYLRTKMGSSDAEVSILAMEKMIEINNAIIIETVQMLESSPNRYLIAERLPQLGSAIIDPLKEIIGKTKNAEVRVLGSLILAHLNCLEDYSILEKEVEMDGPYACLAINKLILYDLDRSVQLALSKLRSFSVAQCKMKCIQSLVSCFLSLLLDKHESIPDDVKLKYSSKSMPVNVRMLVG